MEPSDAKLALLWYVFVRCISEKNGGLVSIKCRCAGRSPPRVRQWLGICGCTLRHRWEPLIDINLQRS